MLKPYKVLTDARLYIESFLKIKTKTNKIVPFRLNSAQLRLYQLIQQLQKEGKPIRIIILKSRQMGFSTLTEALIYFRTATRKNVNSLIVAHKSDATTNLFRMSKLYHDRNPVRPMMKNSNAKELNFENPSKNEKERAAKPGLLSIIKCATAGGDGVGRSDTFTNVHASELAFWPGDALDTYTGLMQSVPNTPESMVIIESTAKGFNFFKVLWDNAEAGLGGFVPFFAAWFEMDEYRMPYHGETLTEEEEQLKETFGLDNEQIMWRRWCIHSNCGGDMDKFHQEYPATPEEAFIASGTCVFDMKAIIQRLRALEKEPQPKRGYFAFEEEALAIDHFVLKKRKFVKDDHGVISIFKEPEKGRPYTIGGDTAGEGSDFFTLQVIDNITGEQMARLKWQRCDEDIYAKQMYCLGEYYNWALLSPEVNFSTHPVRVLQYLRYPSMFVRETFDDFTGKIKQSFGFRTDGLSRPVLISTLQEFARNNMHLIHDSHTLHEMLTFIRNDKGRAEAEQGEHDDLVMAYGIALMSRGQQRLTMPEDKPKKKAKWTADLWNDYNKAGEEMKARMIEEWGDPF